MDPTPCRLAGADPEVAMLLDHGADPRCMTGAQEDEGPTGQILLGLTNDPPTQRCVPETASLLR